MKSKLFILVLTLATFVAVVIANPETYRIRVQYNTNLRASNSLDSALLASAPAGTTLQVVGQVENWLQINRAGALYWMAAWVNHSRVEGPVPAQPAGNVPSNIDNCCFVDRQCHSDQDWTNGYWAFQNGQCAAPAQTQIQSPAQPASNASRNSDNCCFVDRQCQTDQEWGDGYWAYQRNECPAQTQPGSSSAASVTGHAIRIEASSLNLGYLTEALNRLRAGSQKWYNYVISGANLIREDPNIYTAGALSEQRIILIAPYDRLITASNMDVNLARTMAMLVHEACHIHHRDAGFVYNGYTKVNEESACIEQEKAALRDAVPLHLQGEYSTIGITHCEGDLTKHPRCRFFRENCEWDANGKLIDCPAIGLIQLP